MPGSNKRASRAIARLGWLMLAYFAASLSLYHAIKEKPALYAITVIIFFAATTGYAKITHPLEDDSA